MNGMLRRGGIADMDLVMAVMAEAFDPDFGEAWTHGQCTGILALTGVWIDLALDGDGSPEGFALSRVIIDEAELLLLAVRPAARRRGTGRALVERVVGEAAARGAGRVMLEMRDGNPAGRLYEATGFRAVGRRAGYYRGAGGAMRDAITLARDIAR